MCNEEGKGTLKVREIHAKTEMSMLRQLPVRRSFANNRVASNCTIGGKDDSKSRLES